MQCVSIASLLNLEHKRAVPSGLALKEIIMFYVDLCMISEGVCPVI